MQAVINGVKRTLSVTGMLIVIYFCLLIMYAIMTFIGGISSGEGLEGSGDMAWEKFKEKPIETWHFIKLGFLKLKSLLTGSIIM